jgi:DNA invertase Pin-like site-specific DNA recombinase
MQDESLKQVAYSYARYSSLPQGDGDSVRRQLKLSTDWCKRNNAVLDASRTYLDRGKSAYHGKHRQKGGALAAFLDDVESGRIPRGSFLLIENLDRLSREKEVDALGLLIGLLRAGICVVTLSPTEAIFDQDSGIGPLVLALLELGRGHSESKIKADRRKANWEVARQEAKENGKTMTAQTPAWIEVKGERRVLIPERVKIVRRIFDLTLQGYGLSLVVRELTRAGIEPWGPNRKIKEAGVDEEHWKKKESHTWSKTYIHKILTNRAVLGECRVTTGEVLTAYYPPVIDESTWFQAQASLARRKDMKGPMGEKVATLFGGLLRDAITQDHLRIAWQTRGVKGKTRQRRRVLVTAQSMEGAVPSLSFPHDVFEQAILSLLKEVNPADVLGKEPERESASVAAELAVKEGRLRQIEAELTGDGDDVPVLVRAARSLSAECDVLRRRLATLRQQESNPRSVAWSETQSLLDVAKDETGRLRLRELLRTIIEEIWILIVPRRSYRLAAVQVYFAGDGRRDYLIWYKAAGHGRKGDFDKGTLPPRFTPRAALDLRDKRLATSFKKTLEAIDLDLLVKAMQEM